ncbi:NAD(+) synthase [Ignatzschineria sp. LJL83]
MTSSKLVLSVEHLQVLENYIVTLEKWLQEELDYRGAENFIFGVSGGVDSAVIAMLLARNFRDRAIGIMMPSHSHSQDLEDAKLVMEAANLPYHIVDLTKTHDALMTAIGDEYNHTGDVMKDRVIFGNNSARLRMTTLYTIAQTRNGVVVGTDNAVEWHTGYFTKFGDGGVDIAPLIHLDKDEVFALAKMLGVPESIIDKKPSAGLWEAQTDEDEMGVTYNALNRHLRGESVTEAELERINFWHNRSHHKRAMPRFPEKPM